MSSSVFLFISWLLILCYIFIYWLKKLNKFENSIKYCNNDPPPLSVLPNPDNWYQSIRPLKEKINTFGEIKMDLENFRKIYEMDLEDVDINNVHRVDLKYKLRKAYDFIKKLKQKLEHERKLRDDLMEAQTKYFLDQDQIEHLNHEKDYLKDELEITKLNMMKELDAEKEVNQKLQNELSSTKDIMKMLESKLNALNKKYGKVEK